MTRVFIGGSRRIVSLTPEVRTRLDRIIEKRLQVLIGDANGADRAVQRYLFEHGHAEVEIFSSDEHPRNNVGRWPARRVRPQTRRRDFAYYAAKDRAMATEATVGLMLWDGESQGTLMNVVRLALSGKPVVVWVAPRGVFEEIRSRSGLTGLFKRLGASEAERLREHVAAEGLSTDIRPESLGLGS